VRRILLRRGLAVAEAPAPAHDRAVGIAALVAEAALEVRAVGREGRRGRLVRGWRRRHVHGLRGGARAGVLVVLHREGDGVRTRRGLGGLLVLLRRGLAVAEAPAPAHDRAVGIAALVAEAALEIRAVGREGRRGRLVRGWRRRHVHGLRGGARAGVLVVLHREGDGVRTRRGIGVRRVLLRRGLAVAEAPASAEDRAVGIAALVAEAALEIRAVGREGRRGRLVRGWRRRHVHGLRGGARAGVLVVLHREGDGVRTRRGIGVRRILLRRGLADAGSAAGRDGRAVGVA